MQVHCVTDSNDSSIPSGVVFFTPCPSSQGTALFRLQPNWSLHMFGGIEQQSVIEGVGSTPCTTSSRSYGGELDQKMGFGKNLADINENAKTDLPFLSM